MYQVTISNNGAETIINAISTDSTAPRLITGSIQKAVNTTDSFTFTIAPNNPGYTLLNALSTLVEVLNTKTGVIEFKGRILLPVENMDSTGLMVKTVTCEGELAFLMDSNTRYGLYTKMTAKAFLTIIINNHNSLVGADKQFQLGNMDIVDIATESANRNLDYDKTLDVIKDKLVTPLAGELSVRNEGGIRYLDYLVQAGEVKTTEIRLSKNLVTIQQSKDPTTVITRLMPLGIKGTTDKRLDIKTVNNGLDYIDDTVAMQEFGIIAGSYTSDTITTAAALLIEGKKQLALNNRMLVKYEITAVDLSLIDLDIDQFIVGNSYPLIDDLMNVNETLRVIGMTIDINVPQNSTMTIGDMFEDIKTYQATNIKANKRMSTLNGSVTNNTNSILTINNTLATSTKDVEQLSLLSIMGV